MKIIIIFLCFILSSCSILWSETVDLSIKSSKNINPNIYNKSSPVVITIYQLSKDNKFKKGTFNNILSDNYLKNDLINKKEIEIQPNKSIQYKIKVEEGVKFIGILAEFRKTDSKNWKKLIDIGEYGIDKIQIDLNKNKMTIKAR